MDIIFQGFQPLLPVWLFLILLVGTIFLSWWSYKKVPGIKRSHFIILFLLRSTAFLILLLLLLNPLFQTQATYTEPPSLLVMLDNSASTSMDIGEYTGTDSYKEVLEALDFQNADSQVEMFSFDHEVQPSSPESLTFNADQTDLSATLQQIKEKEQDITAAVLISDGIYTKGQNPVYGVQDLTIPIFTIAIGDTSTNKDVLVSSVESNSTGYLNTQQPVTATINSTGYKGESITVRLQKEDEVLSAQTVVPDISNHTQEVSFDLTLDTEGLQQYKIVIPELADEWTSNNNAQIFSVDVRDDKQQIASIAFEIHPDVKVIRSLLQEDQNVELTPRTWMGGDRFIEGDLSIDPDSFDLIIIHGFPSTNLPGSISRTVAELTDQLPVLVGSTPQFDLQQFNQNISSLPVTASSPGNLSRVSMAPGASSSGHPILELPPINYEQLSPVTAPVKGVDLAPGASMLLEAHYQGQPTEIPLLAVQELGNRRMAVFMGFNWYRLNQSTSDSRDYTRQLWLNTVSWTITDPANQLLQITPEKPSFSESEPVILNGQLTNEKGETEAQATIDVEISSDTISSKYYTMENLGAGRYQLEVPNMPEGVYSFDATAQKGERTIDTKAGKFTVARSNAEFLDTKRNDQLLRQLSQRTGGSFIPFDSVSVFWDRLEERNLLEPTEEIQTSLIYPNRHIGWFLLILLILTAEWGFRKYLSLP